jgi:hypothetical protein
MVSFVLLDIAGAMMVVVVIDSGSSSETPSIVLSDCFPDNLMLFIK